MAASTILLITGSAPYLGGPTTWQPLRDAAPDLEFRDLDLLTIPPGEGHMERLKLAIENAATGCDAIVGHGMIASSVLQAVKNKPVLLLSPLAITRDGILQRVVRGLVGGPMSKLVASAAKSKMRNLLANREALRRELGITVAANAITPGLLQEAHDRLADPRMAGFNDEVGYTIRLVMAPSQAFETFNGTVLFGNGPMDTKMRRRIPGTVLEDAWGAPMIETPAEVIRHLRDLLG